MIALVLAAATTIVAPPPFDEAKLPEPVLAEQRGGFRLPSGIDVALTVQTDTAVNGALVLRSLFRIDNGSPSLMALVPKAGNSVAVASSAAGAREATTTPVVSFDRASGVHVTQASAQPPLTVGVGMVQGEESVPGGLQAVDLSRATQTDGGVVTASVNGGIRTVDLQGPDISITHIAGDAIGSAILTSGSDRAIDTTTTASIDLRDAGPDVLGSAMLRVEGLALDAVASRL